MTEQSFMTERLKDVEENYKRIRNEISEEAVKSGRRPEEVRLMAVTKTVEPVYINRAIECGADLIGENKVQEFLSKKPELHLDGCEAHLIGHLQTNKVRQIVGEVAMIQAVDSVRLAKEIGKYSAQKGLSTSILLEVNIGNEDSKFGFSTDELCEKVCEISEISGVEINGLMAIPPFDATKEETHTFFSNMRQLFIDIGQKRIHNVTMSILSMGMSGDYLQAVAEGSTLVRVGTAIFGARQYN